MVNLVVPGDPDELKVAGAAGEWHFRRHPDYATCLQKMQKEGACAETYSAVHPASMADGAAVVEAALDEFLVLCLACSYASGSSVTIRRSTPGSEVQQMTVGDHFPRERELSGAGAVVKDRAEFEDVCARFIANSPKTVHPSWAQVRVMIHHLLDAQSCWSLEDLFLSGTTVLQVIAASEKDRAGAKMSFLQGVTAAATRFGIRALSSDFKNMRNDLVHDGLLSGSTFTAKSKQDCARVAADMFDWLDDYFHAVLSLGVVRNRRFDAGAFRSLNAFSL